MLRLAAWLVTATLSMTGTGFTGTQAAEKDHEKKKTLKQYLQIYYYDPEELHQLWRQSEQRKHLGGPFWLGGYYIPPSQQPGPNVGPPLQIWGKGFGTSLWRDPVTGWPLR